MIYLIKYNILLVMLILHFTGYGQSGFKQFFSFDDIEYLSVEFNEIAIDDDKLIIRGSVFVSEINKWGVILIGMDTLGSVQWHKLIIDSSYSYQNNTPGGLYIDEMKIYIPAVLQDDPFLIIVDKETLEAEKKHYPMDVSFISTQKIIEHKNELYIFGIIQRSGGSVDNHALKVDKLGNFKWSKSFGTSSFSEFLGDVIIDENGQLVISSSLSQFWDNGLNYPYIYTIDTAGNYSDIWLGEKNDSKTRGCGPFRKTPDGHWIQASRDIYFSHPNVYNYSPTITCLDQDFNLIWKKNFTDFTYWLDGILDMEYDPIRDEYVIVGNKVVFYSEEWSDAYSSSWLVKFKADGEIIWDIADTSSVGMIPKLHFSAGLEIAPSGSLYAAGYLMAERNYGWIMKVTPDGCFDTLCTTTSILDQINRPKVISSVYPNPASDHVTIELQQWEPGMHVVFYDMHGRATGNAKLTSKMTTIDIDLPGGMYGYNVFQGDVMVSVGRVIVQ